MQATQELLDCAGIGRERLQLRWISSAEGQRFAETVRELTDLVLTNLGPFDADRHKSTLEAVYSTLECETVRWLLGMQHQLTQQQNVYGEKVQLQDYKTLIRETFCNEFKKSLIRTSLQQGPLSVREIDSRTRLGVQNVATLLVEMENQGQVVLHGYRGRTPTFAGC